ncbi:hypothetical protein A6R68_18581 [Neotoma lepida]|uniref:Uncharacterized protein n=1 Tax=Neotoma lepida TaxID=56216 RepID=A0A1A6HMU4_NEOLE|nr:hypothetical protein A6R68_18581 [Neotoma lepida]
MRGRDDLLDIHLQESQKIPETMSLKKAASSNQLMRKQVAKHHLIALTPKQTKNSPECGLSVSTFQSPMHPSAQVNTVHTFTYFIWYKLLVPLWSMSWQKAAAVSYTHLDVYKRQSVVDVMAEGSSEHGKSFKVQQGIMRIRVGHEKQRKNEEAESGRKLVLGERQIAHHISALGTDTQACLGGDMITVIVHCRKGWIWAVQCFQPITHADKSYGALAPSSVVAPREPRMEGNGMMAFDFQTTPRPKQKKKMNRKTVLLRQVCSDGVQCFMKLSLNIGELFEYFIGRPHKDLKVSIKKKTEQNERGERERERDRHRENCVMTLSVLECSFPTQGEAYLDEAEVEQEGRGGITTWWKVSLVSDLCPTTGRATYLFHI